MSETSLSLLERVCADTSGESWEKLVAIYTPILRRWLGHSELQPSDEDDLVQEALIVVARELKQFQHNGRRGAFRTWLRAIMLNQLRNYWRGLRHRPTASGGSDFHLQLNQLEDPNSELSRMLDREYDRVLLQQLLAVVEPRFVESTWRAFRRIAINGRSAEDVANELGMSVNAVLIAKCRVLKELRREGRGLLGD